MKHYFLLIFSSLSFLLSAQTNVIDEVIWIVGDDAILRSEVEEQRVRMQFEGTKMEGDPNCVIPEEIAIQKLLLHQAKIDSISESPSSVSAQVDQRINYFISQIGSREKMEEYFGKTSFELREELREIVGQQMVAQRIQQKIIGDVRVTPSEVRDFFTGLSSDQIPIIPAKTEVQIITIEPTISVQEIESVKARLREFRERIESGDASFSTLAVLYSEDTETARRGGELGFTGRGMLVQEFATAAFNLSDPKRVSQIVETEYGFHIIQLVEKRGDRINVRHILMKPKADPNEKKAAMEKLDTIANSIRTGKMTFENAVVQFSSDKNTRMNAGLMVNAKTGDSKFQFQDLPQEVARIASTLEVGEISKPFTMINSSGKEVSAIVKIKSKVPAQPANLNDNYQEIKDMLMERKGKEAFEKWIANKQKETYIMIKDGWKNCNFRFPGWVR